MPSVEVSHHLDITPELPPHILEIAIKQGEDPDKVCEYLEEFRNMIYERGDCTPHRTDDAFLLKFLRCRFFKMENSYKLLCRYYSFRSKNKIFFEGVHPMGFGLQNIGDDDIVSVFPYREQTGKRMMIYKIGNWQPSKIPVEDLFRITLILLEVGSLEPQAQVMGGIGIFDLDGFSLNHVWNMSPSLAQKMISIMVQCMPLRTTAIHIVNQSWAFDICFQMFKPFLTERMKSQIYVHGSDLSSLHKHIDPAHLPIRYGGSLDEYPYTAWMTNMVNNDQILKELKLQGYIVTPEDLEHARLKAEARNAKNNIINNNNNNNNNIINNIDN